MSIPVTAGPPSNLPGVALSVPPLEYLVDLSAAVSKFVDATIRPTDNGGFVGVAMQRPDGTINVNLAVVQRLPGEHTGTIVGWVGTEKSWGKPLTNFNWGLAWQARW